jgi:acyl dehydratase
VLYQGKFYEEVATGETFASRMTVTETHVVTAAGLFGDFNPVHVDEVFASDSIFEGRVLHGPFTAALMSAAVGMYFAGTAIAYLEHNCRFLAPVRPGDTLTSEWTVRETLDKPRQGGGIVVMDGRSRNTGGIIVAEAEGKILIKSKG